MNFQLILSSTFNSALSFTPFTLAQQRNNCDWPWCEYFFLPYNCFKQIIKPNQRWTLFKTDLTNGYTSPDHKRCPFSSSQTK